MLRIALMASNWVLRRMYKVWLLVMNRNNKTKKKKYTECLLIYHHLVNKSKRLTMSSTIINNTMISLLRSILIQRLKMALLISLIP